MAVVPPATFAKIFTRDKIKPAELLTILITAAGLISLFVLLNQTQEMAKQTRELSASLESTAYQTITNQELDLDKMFVDHPELRSYFFEGKDTTPDDPNYTRVQAVADFELDVFDSFYSQAPHVPDITPGNPAWTAWDTYIKDSFANSSALCRRLDSVQRWYTPSFIAIAAEACPPGTLDTNR